MARKRHTAEEIVSKLRQVDVLTAQLTASSLLLVGLVLVAGAVLSRVESHI